MSWESNPLMLVTHWKCPKCLKGNMVANGGFWATASPGWHHDCDSCGYASAIHQFKFPLTEVIDCPL